MAYCYLCDREIDENAVGEGEGLKEDLKPSADGRPSYVWVHRWCSEIKGNGPLALARSLIQFHLEQETAPAAIANQDKVFG